MKGQGQWNAYVEAGATREEQGERYNEAPEELKQGIVNRMAVVKEIKKFHERIRKEREAKKR